MRLIDYFHLAGHDVHTQLTADLSRQSQILELRGHLPLDAAGY